MDHLPDIAALLCWYCHTCLRLSGVVQGTPPPAALSSGAAHGGVEPPILPAMAWLAWHSFYPLWLGCSSWWSGAAHCQPSWGQFGFKTTLAKSNVSHGTPPGSGDAHDGGAALCQPCSGNRAVTRAFLLLLLLPVRGLLMVVWSRPRFQWQWLCWPGTPGDKGCGQNNVGKINMSHGAPLWLGCYSLWDHHC